MVKADAYSHGIERVAGTLFAEGARTFGVGTVDEGVLLRKSLPQATIYSLLGPLGLDDYKNLIIFGIKPVIHSWDQLTTLAECLTLKDQLRIGLKFDTGMSRLGFKPEACGRLVEFFRVNPALNPDMICSHLAFADNPDMGHQARQQLEVLNSVCEAFNQSGYKHKRSLANSAAILNFQQSLGDLARPGIALYGGNPFVNTAIAEKGRRLKQAMHVSAPVLSVHQLPKGQGISYGLTFTAPRDMRVAIIGCGYADNYARSLSNKSWMLFDGHRLPVLGRVCMQLTAVDVSSVPEISFGDQVFVLGGPGSGCIDVHELAGWWKTISYEVFCLLGKNEKKYINF